MFFRSPRGTRDIFFEDSQKFEYVTKILMEQAELFGFIRARTPVFEYEELFRRTSGDGSEVVQKEMYTFEDRSGRKLALRPEGTAGIARAVIQGGFLAKKTVPLNIFYILPCYRYERPQSGRYREFTQFGVEVLGTSSYLADVQVISLAESIFKKLSISNRTVLKINSIGCKKCREEYISELKSFFGRSNNLFCPDCLSRMTSNPLRVLDCKHENCRAILRSAPSIVDFLCKDCSENFSKVRSCLDGAGVNYTVDPKIVRGLDYYNGVVFEIQLKSVSDSSLALCGGGRYNNLMESLGCKPTGALGFGIGVDRLISVMEDSDVPMVKELYVDLFIAYTAEKEMNFCFFLVKKLLDRGMRVAMDVTDRTLNAQLKYSKKLNSRFLLIVGERELTSGKARIEGMDNKLSFDVSLNDYFAEQVEKILGSTKAKQI